MEPSFFSKRGAPYNFKGVNLIRRIIKIIEGINEWVGRISVWAVCVITGIVVYEVITRRLFGSPHVWTYEIITLFFGFHFMILAGYTLLYRAHVSIDILYNRLTPKRQALLDVITYLLFFFPFLIILFKIGWDNAAASWAIRETTLTARLPIVMPSLKTITPVTAFLLLIQGFAIFYRRLYFLFKGDKLD